jgi:hypothetical protein
VIEYKLCRRRHNLYSITTNQAAIAALFRVINRYVGNLPPMPGVFPDYPAPVVRNAGDGRELTMMRWGMPPPPRTGGPPVTNKPREPPGGRRGARLKDIAFDDGICPTVRIDLWGWPSDLASLPLPRQTHRAHSATSHLQQVPLGPSPA